MRLSRLSLVLCAVPTLAAIGISYPPAKKAEVVDDFRGTKVADPYRWLETADDPATVAWVDAENALTRRLLDRPQRAGIKTRLQELWDFPRITVPIERGRRLFLSRNTGLQNQNVLFVRDGIDAGVSERVLLDPNPLSDDGTVALTLLAPSPDGSLLAYALSRSGSDRQEIFVREVASGIDRGDHLLFVKFSSIAWLPTNNGFYYTRFPVPGSVPAGDENYFGRVHFHHLGDAQEQDALVFERPDIKEIIPRTEITRDGRYLVISSARGERNEVHVLDRRAAASRAVPLFQGFEHMYRFAGAKDDRLFFLTDNAAPLGRVVAVDFAGASREAVEVIPEGTDKLSSVDLIADRLVTVRLHDASHRLAVHRLDGTLERRIELPELGSISGLNGEPDGQEMYLGVTTFTAPLSAYRYDFREGKLSLFEKAVGRTDPDSYQTEQVFFASKDGTRVPMFLVHKKGLPQDGERPTLLTGYGGFNISLTPSYNPARYVWLERGGILATVNLRGGGEYGEAWHRAGILSKKQNVFDDFIAAAESLIVRKWTRSGRLAIQGGSNGGLLVGAAMVQRPDLFGAVVCQVPVADMLRYHLFTVGRLWIPEYGSAEDPEMFPVLHRYSPYHNIKNGVDYPATLVTTADTDDRVAPGLAKKLAARLQAATQADKPILIRVETKAGHGGGKPVGKQIDEAADIYTFLFWQLDVGD